MTRPSTTTSTHSVDLLWPLLVTEELKKNVSDNLIVYKNLVPAEYMDLDPYTGLVATDKKKKILRMQPRLGAF